MSYTNQVHWQITVWVLVHAIITFFRPDEIQKKNIDKLRHVITGTIFVYFIFS